MGKAEDESQRLGKFSGSGPGAEGESPGNGAKNSPKLAGKVVKKKK